MQERQFQQFCGYAEILPIDYDIIDLAATLWSDGQATGVVVDDGDLIIAATALVHKLPVVTANTRHFAWIEELTLTNWREA